MSFFTAMLIICSNGLNFSSHNKTIRIADKVARDVNNNYRHISSSKFVASKYIERFPGLKKRLGKLTMHKMRKLKDKLYDDAATHLQKIMSFIEPVKKYKVCNCGDGTQIAAIMAKVNGINDCHIVHLCNQDGKDLNHAASFVNDIKPYIIDTWLGEADYVPNMMTKYKSLFRFEDDAQPGLCTKIDDEYTDFLKDDFSKKQRKKILKIYPELKI